MMQELNMVSGAGSIAQKVDMSALEPSSAPPTFINRNNDLMVEQYVTSLDSKLQQATGDLEAAEAKAAEAQKRADEKAHEFVLAKQAWEKEKAELKQNQDDLAAQLSQLQMRQAQKATDEFNAYWDQKKKQADEDSSSVAAALIKAEGHIKSLQETNANLCYRLSEMRQDLIKLENAAAQK
eukprot:scaffold9477_cov197-Amphora_coffeaeformis.AAC.5